MTTIAPPRGCGNISSDYYLLCDTVQDWGIVLESLTTAGVLTTIILILVLLGLICKVQDNFKRSLVPVQFFFLLGTLGIFGLTFAFIIKLNERTAPTRFFLFGVLFALCFSCLLVHAFNLIKLVRGRTPSSAPVSLVITLSLTIVQIIIAIQYVAINIATLQKQRDVMDHQTRDDFVLLLIYVLFLMALLFVACMFVFCGQYRRWKRHGVHIFITILFSIGIWVAWITLLTEPNRNATWNDPVMSVALVTNGWVFLIVYVLPEFCILTAPQKPGDYPPENSFCQPKHLKRNYGVENQAYAQEDSTQEETGDRTYIPYSTHFQLETLPSQQDFSIPRPKTRSSPYQEYAGGKGVK
ncbi:retinoic acid-induced protein 3-like [Heteronotia binoei]|uniref:retinoic acid-induced protein 3-like n=1 Tax=Heteronotia binoei TaxID=13085 RepID=UPI00292D7B32|nr:retinoic acid-induced protein 3-like [Heteronotia binoei]XP_060101283.1 retinoic acid-induced protein 3-like [Heteronotia binoei]